MQEYQVAQSKIRGRNRAYIKEATIYNTASALMITSERNHFSTITRKGLPLNTPSSKQRKEIEHESKYRPER